MNQYKVTFVKYETYEIDAMNKEKAIERANEICDEDCEAWLDPADEIRCILINNWNDCHFTVLDDEGEEETYRYISDEKDKMFIDLSKTLCYADFTNDKVIEIVWNNEPIRYVGWRPDMEYTFVDSNNEVVYSNHFPKWEH